MSTEKTVVEEPDPNESPFELPPIEGLPFDDDSEEARAIERILAWGEPERPPARSRPRRLAAWLRTRLRRERPRA